MLGYVVRRLAVAVVVVIGVSMLVFVLLSVVAGPPGRVVLGPTASAQAVADFNTAHGYDKPIAEQYWNYFTQLLHGDLGFSYKLNQSVVSLFAENTMRSVYLAVVSLVLAILVAVPLGIYQAVKRNSAGDHLISAGAFTLYSMPSFFVGLLLIQAFSLSLHIFPAEASQATTLLGVIGDPRSMVLPIVSLAAIQVASYSVYMRSAALDGLTQDYIRLARAKGLSEPAVLRRHLLRNSALPMINLIGLSVPVLMAGNLLIETLFNYPGLGLMFYTALGKQDYPVLLAYVLVGGVLTVLGNLLADVAVSIADPRIRLS